MLAFFKLSQKIVINIDEHKLGDFLKLYYHDKSIYYCLSYTLFNLNRIVIGRLMRWYRVVPQYCTTNEEITQ